MKDAALQPDVRAITAIERPSPKLWTLYLFRALLSGPALVVLLPYLWFRYHTMRYRFDEQGVHMRWGLLFRREINLTYARIQDIHLRSGIVQRWLGLADIQIQTAAGSSTAEMTIEGLVEHAAVRDFLYARMRGHDRAAPAGGTARGGAAAGTGAEAGAGGEAGARAGRGAAAAAPGAGGDTVAALRAVAEELRLTRAALERLAGVRTGEGA